ncbi:MAG: cache domain-containing protein [Sulfuricurvum sp.]|uniref:cache domain-containing protein n=1 Tax=Sulfuricurvum sp. TaxID=2025608 RepID=UPI002601B639|nr:cache domain-containing protein [Sulfuricurvum sp.]MDD2951253.1 cache domain-containing protein [Sulfuricurvum sp.]
MNSNSFFKKSYIFITIAVVIALVVIWSKNLDSIAEVKDKIYTEQTITMEKVYAKAIKDESDVVMTNADNISRDSGIIQGLKINDRNMVLESLKSIKKSYKSNTIFGNVKIHVHDRNIHSFVRLWNPDKYGDDLSGFRKSIVAVKEKHAPLVALEVGVTGVELRGIIPIFSADEYVGSVEFMQGTDTIVKALKNKFNIDLIIALDNRYSDTAKELQHATKINQNLILATNEKMADKTFLEDLKTTALNTNLKTFNTKHYYTEVIPVKDFSGDVVAYALLGQKLEVLDEKVKETKSLLIEKLVLNSVLGILSLILFIIILRIMIFQIRVWISK